MRSRTVRKGFLLILIMALCLFACACQKKEGAKEETGATASEYVQQDYDADFRAFSGEDGSEPYNARLGGKYLWYRAYDEAGGTWIVKREDAETNEVKEFFRWDGEEKEGELWSVHALDVMKDGHVFVLYGCHEVVEGGSLPSAKKYVLEEFEVNEAGTGKKCNAWPVEDGAVPESLYLARMTVSGEGNICLETQGSLILLSEGKKAGEIRLEDGTYVQGFARATDGTPYVLLLKGFQTSVCKINFRTASLETLEGFPERVNGIAESYGTLPSGVENGLLYADEDGLFCFDLTAKNSCKLIAWSDVGVRGQEVREVGYVGEKAYIFSLASGEGKKGEFAILNPRNEVEGAEKSTGPKSIKLAVIHKYSVLSKLVSDYNRSQKNYRVEVVEYGKDTQSSQEWQDVANRMMADMLGEEPPDVMDLGPFALVGLDPSLEDLMEKEYVEDLLPYLERSKKVSKEDFEPKILEIFSCPKGLPAIPTSYDISTVIVPAGEFSGDMGWKVSDLIAYDKAHPDLDPVEGCSSWQAYFFCIKPNIPSFVDRDKKEANFDCAEFREMMEYAHSFPAPEGIIPANAYSENQFLAEVRVVSLLGIQTVTRRYFGKNAKIQGYPSVDGRPLSILDQDADSIALAICKRSGEKEGAWDFVEYVLTHGTDVNSYAFGGIPTNKKILEENWEKLAAEDGPLKGMIQSMPGTDPGSFNVDPFGEEEPENYIFIHPLSEGDRKTLQDLLDSAQTYDQETQKILRIVWSECKEYFNDQKTLDQTIEAIQGRVSLYLKE